MGSLSALDIIAKMEKARQSRRNRSIGYKTASIKAGYAGLDVQIFYTERATNLGTPHRRVSVGLLVFAGNADEVVLLVRMLLRHSPGPHFFATIARPREM